MIPPKRDPHAPVTEISVCKLPYQDHFFVHGVRAGHDVWLRQDGTWSEEDGDEKCRLPGNEYLSDLTGCPT